MKMLEKMGIEYSFKDMAIKSIVPFIAAFGLANLVGRGTVPESSIAARGNTVATLSPLYHAEVHRSQLEEEADKFGFYVNNRMYGPGFGIYGYTGDAPKSIDFQFRFSAGKTIEDIILKVDGKEINVAHTYTDGEIVGHSRFTDFTQKGNYDVVFIVQYEGGQQKVVSVKVKKENEKKNP